MGWGIYLLLISVHAPWYWPLCFSCLQIAIIFKSLAAKICLECCKHDNCSVMNSLDNNHNQCRIFNSEITGGTVSCLTDKWWRDALPALLLFPLVERCSSQWTEVHNEPQLWIVESIIKSRQCCSRHRRFCSPDRMHSVYLGNMPMLTVELFPRNYLLSWRMLFLSSSSQLNYPCILGVMTSHNDKEQAWSTRPCVLCVMWQDIIAHLFMPFCSDLWPSHISQSSLFPPECHF
jgi:hypothetical protein